MSNYSYYVTCAAKFEFSIFFSLRDMTSQRNPLSHRERVIELEHLPPENGLNFKIMNFMPRIVNFANEQRNFACFQIPLLWQLK